MDMMGRMAQSPAVQQMAQRLAAQLDPSSSSAARSRRGGGPGTAGADVGRSGGADALDFGSFAQQMMPLLGQVMRPSQSAWGLTRTDCSIC